MPPQKKDHMMVKKMDNIVFNDMSNQILYKIV